MTGKRSEDRQVEGMMMRRVTTTIAMTLAWAAGAAQTTAEPEAVEYPRYTVEVIIFEYAEEVSVGTERFLPEVLVPPERDDGSAGDELVFSDTGIEATAGVAVEEQLPEPDGPEFVLHPEEELNMTDIASRLERLDVYRPVMHFAWTQVTRPEEETRPIELQSLAEPPEGLEGTFTLYLSRYLHLVVDLSLEQRAGLEDPFAIDDPPKDLPSDPQAVFGDSRGGASFDELRPPPVHFRIVEDRIFKSGELRYFDHPKFGVLAKITRVEEPDDEDIEAELVGKLGQ
jgi:hypothetical protein